MTKTQSKIFWWVLAIFILGGISLALYDHFKKNKNLEIISNGNNPVTPAQPVQVILLRDSFPGYSQPVLVTGDKATLGAMQESLQALLNKKEGVSPEILASYTSLFRQYQTTGKYSDSVLSLIDEILQLQNINSTATAEINRLKTIKVPYTVSDGRYRYEKGTLDLNGNIQSDTLSIVSFPKITFGEKRSFLKRPVYTATITDDNSFISYSDLHTYKYVPKEKIQLSATGIGVTDGKAGFLGAGLNVKYKWFSFTGGYVKQIFP